MSQQKNSNQTKNFLWYIGKMIINGVTIALEIHRYHNIYLSGGGHDEVLELKRASQKKLWQKNLQQLKRSGYIKIKNDATKMIIGLTNKGQTALLRYQIKNSPLCQPGSSTLIFFDIPEPAAAARKQLRKFLQTTDFKQIQKSVWQHKYDVTKPLQKFITDYNLTDWVKIARAKILI
ncbi:MAG: hypothetical protein WC575_03275 [Patescibacteria group bacterium]